MIYEQLNNIEIKLQSICKFILFISILLMIFVNFSYFFVNDKKNIINVAYAFDNNYEYITHVSMKSIMLSQNANTFIKFYLLVSNLTLPQKYIINKIKYEHKNCEINFFDMGLLFKNFSLPLSIWSTAIYYRIILQYLLPDEKKILYLDTDTLIYKDLTKIYNYGIDHKYYVGMLEKRGKKVFKQYNINFNEYINSGVILCNLEELRKQNITNEYLKFFEKFKGNIRYPLNDGLNYVSKGKIGYFSPEYVVIGFCDQKEAFNYYKNMNIKVNRTKVVNSYKDPYIYHFILKSKPWRGIPSYHNKICVDPMTRFYEMARKTSFYYDILKIFSIKFPKTI